MSADLFDFHGRGDGGWADDGWREKEADTAEPDEECGPRCQCFFFIRCHIIQGRLFSFSPRLCTDVSQEDITGCELGLMCGHSATPEYEILPRGRRGRTGHWWMMTMWEQASVLFWGFFLLLNYILSRFLCDPFQMVKTRKMETCLPSGVLRM